MAYPKLPRFNDLANAISRWAEMKHEYGSKGVNAILRKIDKQMQAANTEMRNLSIDKKLAAKEPNDLKSIKLLRPNGPRRIWESFNAPEYTSRMEGALLGRFAGCTLGAIVEFWDVPKMENWAKYLGHSFPPTDYWPASIEPNRVRYGGSTCESYTRDKMDGVPVDDDLTYTHLGLLIAEDYGPNFTVKNVGEAWSKYLPYACTAEAISLINLKKKVPTNKVGEKDNLFCEWIGADIRSDPWGYMAPGFPEFAANMAYRDAYISHRRQGIYGEMFFSAAIAAAFTVDDPMEALHIGLTEIPKDCALTHAIHWALEVAPKIKNYKQAREAVDKKFLGMSGVHTNNNACLTVFGLSIGGRDLTKVISETVAMGLDNDCTAATAGSICGAVIGKKNIPPHWYKRFNNVSHSYLNGHKSFKIDDLLKRFKKQAQGVHALK